jgi:phosphatidylglycerol---prolipoprotein diacylglyceryl transferase
MILDYIIWNADPVLFRIGNVVIRWYSVLLVLSFYISYLFVDHIFEREHVSKTTMHSFGIYIIVGLLLGGRLVHCLFYEPEYYLKFPLDIIRPWRGELGNGAKFVGYRGMSGHGSVIGIILGIVINAVRTKTSIIWMIDRIAIFGPLIGFFVRIGNLFNSEILGTSSNLPWAFVFRRIDSVPRHPVQLYEAIAYLIIFIFSWEYYKRLSGKEKPGAILGLVLVLVYTTRFFLEFFKAEQSRIESSMTLNMGQVLSIPFVVIGLILLLRPMRKQTVSDNKIQDASEL